MSLADGPYFYIYFLTIFSPRSIFDRVVLIDRMVPIGYGVTLLQNPSKPHFNHYLFESICICIRNTCKEDKAKVSVFEANLFPPFTEILQQDVTGRAYRRQGKSFLSCLFIIHRSIMFLWPTCSLFLHTCNWIASWLNFSAMLSWDILSVTQTPFHFKLLSPPRQPRPTVFLFYRLHFNREVWNMVLQCRY